jgi:hypothetical protein
MSKNNRRKNRFPAADGHFNHRLRTLNHQPVQVKQYLHKTYCLFTRYHPAMPKLLGANCISKAPYGAAYLLHRIPTTPHHSAQYDVIRDVINYEIESRTKFLHRQIPYIRFCEKVVTLYSQLEVVSIYAHWLRKKSLGI